MANPEVKLFSPELRDRILELVPSFCVARKVGVIVEYASLNPDGVVYAGFSPQDDIINDEDLLTLKYVEPIITGEEAMSRFVGLILEKQDQYGFSSLTPDERNILTGSDIPLLALQSLIEIRPNDAEVALFIRSIGKIRDNGTVDIWKDANEAFPATVNEPEPVLSFLSEVMVEERMDQLSRTIFQDAFTLNEQYELELIEATDRIVYQNE
jgi:hypothetical protein